MMITLSYVGGRISASDFLLSNLGNYGTHVEQATYVTARMF